ncbi:O-antigen ligase family protein [Vagococcus lutrae]|uniref:O-antigen ligase family protein n=1 Tax=Vagococcus lutrae TaxID=81947 RepID=UPI002097B832|nr:O-antigen ligase family protein [Vagococcus lutrae]MCO7150878.1 O-antigen ligase family protein [Vagococcus lutrae]
MNIDKSRYKMIILFPIIYSLMPRPEFNQGLVGLLFLVPILLLCIVIYSGKLYFRSLDKKVISYFFATAFLYGVSSLINYDNVTIDSLMHIFKPIYFIIIYIYSISMAEAIDEKVLLKAILKGAYASMIIQLFFVLPQLFGKSISGVIYSEAKTRGLGEIVRVTGTFANPNILSWFILQFMVVVLILERKQMRKNLFIAIGFLIIFLAGSRSILLLSIVFIPIVNLYSYKKIEITKLIKFFVVISFFIFILKYMLKNFGEMFPYINEINLILENKSLENFKSFNTRTDHWQSMLLSFRNQSFFFGAGPGVYRVMDNDFLYQILNYGAISATITIVFYIIIMFYGLLEKDKIGKIISIFILLMFIVGFQVETFGGWIYPVYTISLLGIKSRLDNQNY